MDTGILCAAWFILVQVYRVRKGQFMSWANDMCDLRKNTQLLYQQHDTEVARLLLLDLLQSPLGLVASNRLAHDQMQGLVNKLVRKMKEDGIKEEAKEMSLRSVPRNRAVTFSTTSDLATSSPVGPSVPATSFLPPDRARSASLYQPDAGPSSSDAVPDSVIRQITLTWREVLRKGVSILSENEPEYTEVHISKLSGSPVLWGIVAPFLPHTALYLATVNMGQATGDLSPAEGSESAAAERMAEQEHKVRSQLTTVMSLQPPHHYSHRIYEDQKQPVPAFIMCGVDWQQSECGGKFRHMMDRILHSCAGHHMVERGTGNILLNDGSDEEQPMRKICYLRRQIDVTMRTMLQQRGNDSMVPLVWLKVEDCFHRMRATGKYFMSARDECLKLVQITTSNAMKDIFSLSNMLQYFHAMGWVCFFPRVPALADTVFIDPTWLINLLCDIFGVSGEPLPSLHESAITLHETGRMEQPLLDHYSKYLTAYTELNPGRTLLEDFDLAAKCFVQDEICLFVPGAVLCDTHKYSLEDTAGRGNPPPIHLVFADQLHVLGFTQRLLVLILRSWQPQCVALARSSGQLWLDGGSWQLIVVETADSIAVAVVDPMAGQEESGFASEAEPVLATSNPTDQGGAESATSQLAGVRSTDTSCTSLLAARHCPVVLDFILDCTSTLRDHWFPSLSVSVCFEAAAVGFQHTAPETAEPEEELDEKYVDFESCAGLPSVWCWFNSSASCQSGT